MYTRCPQCQTVFRITAAQLKARDGMVRCGRCQHVFGADQHLMPRPAKGTVKAASPAARKRATSKKVAVETNHAAVPAESIAPPFPAETPEYDVAPPPLVRRRPVRTRTVYWAAGCVLLILLLAGQTLIFYGHDFARQTPALRPMIETLCAPLPCRKLPPIDMRHMDLVETQVAPHPRYDKALRIKATLVNRADTVQPYPLLEVSLMDSQGQLVARRAYQPREYLSKPEAIQQGLPPQVAVSVQLDITSPGAQASGYEVLLLPSE
ncbi:MAG TPA: DUF3426 domain-containing protein [Acidiferrobacterales bacterium]|nr:DUF3426 domain-containing protein [Acidiferrobacterales bacterium]